jgi:hypothetical protein
MFVAVPLTPSVDLPVRVMALFENSSKVQVRHRGAVLGGKVAEKSPAGHCRSVQHQFVTAPDPFQRPIRRLGHVHRNNACSRREDPALIHERACPRERRAIEQIDPEPYLKSLIIY